MPRVLILFERSGVVRRAFARRGWQAISVDTAPDTDAAPMIYPPMLDAPAEIDPWSGHLRADVYDLLTRPDALRFVSLVIAHPDCQYLSSSGLHWNTRRPERAEQTARALEQLQNLAAALARVPAAAIENPIGAASRVLGRPSQIVQPYQFGHDASKRTALWLRHLPTLRPTAYIPPRWVCSACEHVLYEPPDADVVRPTTCPHCRALSTLRPRWANQTDSGQNRLPPSHDRAIKRATTYPGIADAMAHQWTEYLEQEPQP